jgi:unsaturated rhamnogalacturonyl hydrolase
MKLRNTTISFALVVSVWIATGAVFGDAVFSQQHSASVRVGSLEIAQSFLKMHPDSITYRDEPKSARWNYEQGLMLEACFRMWEHTRDKQYLQYIKRHMDYYIADDGSIRTYRVTEYNLDNLMPGKALVRLSQQEPSEKYRRATDTLMSQFENQPRTKDGGFWHKAIYPHQMWLDGLYMGQPFRALYANVNNKPAFFDDIAKQFLLIEQHLRDSKTGLFYHGWDESKQQKWADPKTGCSPNFWGRSIGWYAMALVDVLEYMPKEHPQRGTLLNIVRNLAESILTYRDESTKLWYQVMDKAGAPGNYLEASASSMFTYVFAKGANLGYLPESYKNAAAESYQGIVNNFVSIDDNGIVHLNHICKVSGLGGNPYRDGSYEYYVGEPQRTDDFKGYGPFWLAAIELEKTHNE